MLSKGPVCTSQSKLIFIYCSWWRTTGNQQPPLFVQKQEKPFYWQLRSLRRFLCVSTTSSVSSSQKKIIQPAFRYKTTSVILVISICPLKEFYWEHKPIKFLSVSDKKKHHFNILGHVFQTFESSQMIFLSSRTLKLASGPFPVNTADSLNQKRYACVLSHLKNSAFRSNISTEN